MTFPVIHLMLLIQSDMNFDAGHEINVQSDYMVDPERAVDSDLLPDRLRREAESKHRFEKVEEGLDQELQATLDTAKASISASTHKSAETELLFTNSLAAAQRSWRAYRNAHCRAYMQLPGNLGGPERTISAWDCLSGVGKARIAELVAMRPKKR